MGNCLQCSQLCDKCELGVCLKCVAGSDYNGRECVRCGQGQFYDVALKVCLNCPPNCSTCPDRECSTCEPGFSLEPATKMCLKNPICTNGVGYIDGQITCRACAQNCRVCTEDLACISCARGYFLRESLCLSCIDNCIFCFNERHCLQCIQDYWFDPSVSRCIGLAGLQDQARSPFRSIILTPVDWTKMLKFPSQSLVFQRRDPNCVSFGLTGVCMQCRAKYFLGFNNECYPCQGLCLICSGINRCTLCKPHARTESLSNGFVGCTLEVFSAFYSNSRRIIPNYNVTRGRAQTAGQSTVPTA